MRGFKCLISPVLCTHKMVLMGLLEHFRAIETYQTGGAERATHKHHEV